MKAIVLLVLLALTQAAHDTTAAYHLGFVSQLGLDITQSQDAEACYTATERIFIDLHNAITATKAKEGEQVALAVLDLLVTAELARIKDCVAYKQDLFSIFTQNVNGSDFLAFAEENFKAYPTQVIQQVGLWIQALIDGDQYTAGKTEAYLLQILFGLETPEILPVPEFNISNYVPLDINTYIPELVNSYYPTIGITDQTVLDQLTSCGLNSYNLINDIANYKANFTGDVANKIHVVSELIEKLADTVDTCTPVIEFEWDTNMKMLKILFESPLLNFGKIILNIGKNLPEIINNGQISELDFLYGNYTGACILQGENMKTYFDGVFNFTEITN